MKSLDYRGLVGSIACLSLTSRPDLAYSANLLSRFLSNPGLPHWQAAKHVLRYLRGTSDVVLTFTKCLDVGLIGYTDSDYAIAKTIAAASLVSVFTWAVVQSHGLLEDRRVWQHQQPRPRCMH